MDRDIDSLTLGDVTLRIGWRHVEGPCRTAIAVGRVLTARGWTGGGVRLLGQLPGHRAHRARLGPNDRR